MTGTQQLKRQTHHLDLSATKIPFWVYSGYSHAP
jgi:hypothetical protein